MDMHSFLYKTKSAHRSLRQENNSLAPGRGTTTTGQGALHTAAAVVMHRIAAITLYLIVSQLPLRWLFLIFAKDRRLEN